MNTVASSSSGTRWLPEGLPASPWVDQCLTERVEMLTRDLDTSEFSELGLIGLVDEFHRAAKFGATASVTTREARLSDVVMIGGLPRSGTTFLQILLSAAMADRRTLRGWEAFEPTSVGQPDAEARAMVEARNRFRAARQVAPGLHDLHPLDADGMEECTALLQNSFACLQWAMMVHSPRYVEWLLSSRIPDAYQLWRAQLGLIDEVAPSWLLKSPMHMVDYSSLFAAVPNLRLVHVRRRPDEMVRSFLNLCLEVRRVFARSVEGLPQELGAFWLPVLRRLIHRAEADLDDLRADVIVIDFADLIVDPSSIVQHVAERLDTKLTRGPVQPVTPPRSGRRQLPLEGFGLDSRRVIAALDPFLGGRFLAPVASTGPN